MPIDPVDVSRAIAAADASYERIAPFETWIEPSSRGFGSWDDELRQVVRQREAVGSERAEALLRQYLRAAAVDTGAIEGLYDTDRGFTWSVATGIISLVEAERDRGASFRQNFEAQLDAFEYVVDVATSERSVSETLIRQLHEITCAGQERYRVLTPVGWQERVLRGGSYKEFPNSPQRPDGTFHPSAPVHEVANEMARLVDQLRSKPFLEAHPVEQAAYVHHSFVRIHPFADGNGRVARLVASIWLVRDASIPLWVRSDERDEYLDALVRADGGDSAAFVDFVAESSLGLLREASLALRSDELESASRRQKTVTSAAASMNGFLHRVLADRFGPELASWDPSRPRMGLPGGLEFNEDDGIDLVPNGSRGSRWVRIGVDWAAEPSSRFVLVSGPADADPMGQVRTVREPFSEREVVPTLKTSAKRRIEQVVASIEAEHRART